MRSLRVKASETRIHWATSCGSGGVDARAQPLPISTTVTASAPRTICIRRWCIGVIPIADVCDMQSKCGPVLASQGTGNIRRARRRAFWSTPPAFTGGR